MGAVAAATVVSETAVISVRTISRQELLTALLISCSVNIVLFFVEELTVRIRAISTRLAGSQPFLLAEGDNTIFRTIQRLLTMIKGAKIMMPALMPGISAYVASFA